METHQVNLEHGMPNADRDMAACWLESVNMLAPTRSWNDADSIGRLERGDLLFGTWWPIPGGSRIGTLSPIAEDRNG